MPEQESIPNDDTTAADTEAAPRKPSILVKFKILLFVVVVIVVECLAAWLWLPDAAEVAAMASATMQTGDSDALFDEDGSPQSEGPLVDQFEVSLGQFSVTAFQPISNTTLRIDFQLWGTVSVEDEKEFLLFLEDNHHRFREQVIVTVRSTDITDLTDAGLGLVKRKILERTNRMLGKPLLRTVIFSDFSFIEQ